MIGTILIGVWIAIAFVVGFAIGAYIGWRLTKKNDDTIIYSSNNPFGDTCLV